jgi:hypothetical protein
MSQSTRGFGTQRARISRAQLGCNERAKAENPYKYEAFANADPPSCREDTGSDAASPLDIEHFPRSPSSLPVYWELSLVKVRSLTFSNMSGDSAPNGAPTNMHPPPAPNQAGQGSSAAPPITSYNAYQQAQAATLSDALHVPESLTLPSQAATDYLAGMENLQWDNMVEPEHSTDISEPNYKYVSR